MRRSIAALACTLLIVVLAVVMVAIVVGSVIDRADELSAELDQAWQELADAAGSTPVGDFFADLQVDLGATSPSILEGAGVRIGSVVNSAVGVVSGLVLAQVILYYLLKDGKEMPGRRRCDGHPTLPRRPSGSWRRLLRRSAPTPAGERSSR